MRDLIDERNRREKLMSSVIKRANVHYITKEELERQKQLEEEQKAQQEKDEKAAEEAALQLERDREKRKQEQIEQALHDASLPPSSTYGMKESDEVTKEQIDAILAEKQDAFSKMLEDSRLGNIGTEDGEVEDNRMQENQQEE